MDEESKVRGWEKIKKMMEERRDIRTKIIYDNMECLIMQRELLDKLIEFKELSEQARNLTEPAGAGPEEELTSEQKLFYDRKCCKIHQELAFTTFIQNMFCSFMDLLDGTSQKPAWEIGENGLNMIFAFLGRYNELLKQEQHWYQATIAEIVPPES